MTLRAGMVEPEQTPIARQRLGNHVSAARSINKFISVTTQKNRGTVRHGDVYPGRTAVIKSNAFVNSRAEEMSQRFFVGIRQTDVVKKVFNL
jgi:hypothetical protein